MPNTREKLIDVFMHLDRHISNRDEYGICFTSDFVKAIEDVMEILKNGVTVQKWIPVTERLPEESGEYLAYCGEYDGICVLYFEILKTKSKWRTNWKKVTHWMPLPEPPKEEL